MCGCNAKEMLSFLSLHYGYPSSHGLRDIFSPGFLPCPVFSPHSVPFLPPQTDRAVHLLLETDSSSREYYTDALKYVLFRHPLAWSIFSLSPPATEPVWQPPSGPPVPLRAQSNWWPPTLLPMLASWVCLSLLFCEGVALHFQQSHSTHKISRGLACKGLVDCFKQKSPE